MKFNYNNKILSGINEVHTKEELFGHIRQLTRDGYFFEIRNYYNGNGRASYMIDVLGHKDDE